jgi:release factor glutamine methyltransferase
MDEQTNTLAQQEKQWLLEEKYAGEETAEYHADVARLEAGEPIDYLIGHREFLGCHIDLSFRPLIPRNETEFWTHDLITKYTQCGKPRSRTSGEMRVLDMCAGSGCIGIALLSHLPHAQVNFAEYNPQFIEQIKKNLEINKINPERHHVYQSDMFENIGTLDVPKYELIVANPPYIARDRRETVQDSVHNHEDHDSLYADDDGLYYIKQIIECLPHHLTPDGQCYIEYDPWQTNHITEYLDANHPNLTYQILKDQNNKNRVIFLSQPQSN